MFTFFTVPKPFIGHIGSIQTNAILSWSKLSSKNEIIIYGNEHGIGDFSKTNNITNVTNIKFNEFGTPMLDGIFMDVKKRATNDILIYCNSDIIFLKNLHDIVSILNDEIKKNDFLICGRRIDLDVNYLVDFKNKNWESLISTELNICGKLHGYSGIDYFIFNKSQKIKLPPFAVGRMGWDNWFLYNTISKNIMTIDSTSSITAIHQNHKSAYNISDLDNKRNIKLLKGYDNVASIYDVKYLLVNNLLIKPNLKRKIVSYMKFNFPFNYLLSFRRWFIHTLFK